ncbi:2-D-hydroxyacid dehydrogenase [Halococcus morrhuae DSM 1307]|uniref:2-D-hydroxyacid dehydrogenase n=1 Tax=Halococcus morrhuae DSM 1307 TaxID=931277 RepID=M0MFX8_HALMO|nr:D-2-hydroxyacid dehydrogenase [Halococcus morrhuae]EMA44627.1 2-D-hydroxyacid dehydrogenase [Halococcus morrhuae DSM 1307]
MTISRLGVHTSVEELFPPAVLRDALTDAGPTVRIVETDDELAACDALVTFDYEESFLQADLAWIHSILAGVDHFPFDALAEQGTLLTNSAGIHGDSVGETVAGYMLMFARGLHTQRTNQLHQEWAYPPWDAAFTLDGESLCVIGLGTLGRAIAMRADALGMDVTGIKRTPMPIDHVETVYPPDDLHEAVAEARFVALAVPLTDRTTGLIGESELRMLRDDAYLINVARGGVIEQSALVDALESASLAGAALDVFETEPLPDESPLWGMDNVIVTSHAAAANREYYRRVAVLVRENLRRLDANESLTNQVV